MSCARPDCWAPGEAQPRCPGIRGVGEVLAAFLVFIPHIKTVPEILIHLPVSATVKEKPLHLPGELSSLSHITAHIENEIVYTARWGSRWGCSWLQAAGRDLWLPQSLGLHSAACRHQCTHPGALIWSPDTAWEPAEGKIAVLLVASSLQSRPEAHPQMLVLNKAVDFILFETI